MLCSIITQNCFDVPFLNKDRLTKIETLVDQIVFLNPDLVCLQEITFPKSSRLMRNILESKGYFVFSKKYLFGFTQGGLMIASKSPILTSTFVSYRDQGRITSLQIADRAISKGYQLVTLLIDGMKVNVVNTHLYCVYQEDDTIQSRAHQSQLDQLSNDICRLEGNIILTGDLSEPTSRTKTFSKFLIKTGLIDVTATISDNRVRIDNTNVIFQNTKFKAGMTGGKYDYIFASPGLAKNIGQVEIIGCGTKSINGSDQHLSDHYGIRANIVS